MHIAELGKDALRIIIEYCCTGGATVAARVCSEWRTIALKVLLHNRVWYDRWWIGENCIYHDRASTHSEIKGGLLVNSSVTPKNIREMMRRMIVRSRTDGQALLDQRRIIMFGLVRMKYLDTDTFSRAAPTYAPSVLAMIDTILCDNPHGSFILCELRRIYCNFRAHSQSKHQWDGKVSPVVILATACSRRPDIAVNQDIADLIVSIYFASKGLLGIIATLIAAWFRARLICGWTRTWLLETAAAIRWFAPNCADFIEDAFAGMVRGGGGSRIMYYRAVKSRSENKGIVAKLL